MGLDFVVVCDGKESNSLTGTVDGYCPWCTIGYFTANATRGLTFTTLPLCPDKEHTKFSCDQAPRTTQDAVNVGKEFEQKVITALQEDPLMRSIPTEMKGTL